METKKTWKINGTDKLNLYKIDNNTDSALIGLNNEEPKWLLIFNFVGDDKGEYILYNDLKYYL